MKMYLLIIITFFLFALSLSCNTSGNFNSKRLIYESNRKDTEPFRELILYGNGHFDYKHEIGLLSTESSGTWIDKQKEIILVSDSLYRNGYIETKVLKKKKLTDKTTIKVINKEYHEPLISAVVFISNDEYEVTNSEGIVVMDTKEIDSLRIAFLGESYIHKFEEHPTGDIEIYLSEVDLSKCYFEKEVWRKNRNKLISPDGVTFKLMK